MGFGLLRWGFFATVFPNSVIKGMLTAIGITIFSKQIPLALGGAGGMASDVEGWSIVSNDSLLADIARAMTQVTPAAPILCLGTLAVLFAWETGPIHRHPLLSKVPGPLPGVGAWAWC